VIIFATAGRIRGERVNGLPDPAADWLV